MRVIDTEKLPIKLWLDDIEDGALEQAKALANHPFATKWIAIMPDSHQGYGMPIGGVLATRDVVIPNAVGVDIGCGMCAIQTDLTSLSTDDIKFLMGKIREVIPLGFNHQKEEQFWWKFNEAPDIEIIQQELKSAKKQLGTLGGGNHFIEIQKGDDGFIYVMIHSGSRNFGLKTATEYNKKAMELCERWVSDIPNKDLAFLPLDSDEGREYMMAMDYCVSFASANRTLMMNNITQILKDHTHTTIVGEYNIAHNYAAMEHHYGKNVLIHRKGATKASLGLRGIIPGSMGTSSYIVRGLGNPESFESCSHGAGRKMGRKEATRVLNLEEEQAKMANVIHGVRNIEDLDEAPGAYKDIDDVMNNQRDLVEILIKLTSLGSIKG